MPGAHAKLGPSGADRWMVCSASVPLIDRLLAAGELKESDLEDDQREQVTEDELLKVIDGLNKDKTSSEMSECRSRISGKE